jgi:hypothetical protein
MVSERFLCSCAGPLSEFNGAPSKHHAWTKLVRLSALSKALGDPIAPSTIRVHVCGHAKAGNSTVHCCRDKLTDL